MYYGEEKARQMARSILPSKARVSARKELQSIKKRDRRRLRQELHELVLDHDEELGDIEPDEDLRHYPYRKIKYAVRERRDADKLSPFITWAVEITKDIPEPDGRLSKIKKILPKGLIGIHALSHLEWKDEFETDSFRYGFRSWRYREAAPERDWHAERVEQLKQICRSGGGFSLLNRALTLAHSTNRRILGYNRVDRRVRQPSYEGEDKYIFEEVFEYVGPTEPRLLTGIADIEAFLKDIYQAYYAPKKTKESYQRNNTLRYFYRWYIPSSSKDYQTNPDYHPEWFQEVSVFLKRWEDANGNIDKLRKEVKAPNRLW